MNSHADSNETLEPIDVSGSEASGLTSEQYRRKMQRRKEVQEQRLARASNEKGLIIVNTGNGKGKTTAALGMVLRSKEHGNQQRKPFCNIGHLPHPVRHPS
jgi:cob(I)alamin adenosyltransferase